MAKVKVAKFMVYQNPMARPGEIFILHTRAPRFLAKYTPENEISDFEIVDQYDDLEKYYKGDVMKLVGLMRRMGDWFLAYRIYTKKKKRWLNGITT